MTHKHLILILFLATIVAGCVQSPDFIAKSDPLVKDFLEKYPNAEVKIVFFSKLQAQNIIESLKETCGNPYMEAKDYYAIYIEDRESDLSVVAFIDWENKRIDCAVKGSIGRIPTSPPVNTSTSNQSTTNQSVLPQPGKPSTPIQPPFSTINATKGICQSCDDNDKCTFDYCNELTDFKCKHKSVEPCYNNNVCEEDRTSLSIETGLPSGPSCPNLGWVASYRGTLLVSEDQDEKGYFDYVKKLNSGQNNDCPATCDDGNINTSDYYDFDEQICNHYNCIGNTTPTPVPLYPKWEQEQTSITPASLSSEGGAIEASIATQDNGSPAITGATFTLSAPGVVSQTKNATDTCATAIHTGYTSRCWKVTFEVPANNADTTKTYTVKVSNSDIQNTKSGSFTIAAYSGPPIITLGYIGKYLNNSIEYYNSTSIDLLTNVNATCSYVMKVSNSTASQSYPEKQTISADKKYHSDDLANLRPNSTYDIHATCAHLQYSSRAFITFKTNSTLKERPVVYPT